jgi:hypothetical protein
VGKRKRTDVYLEVEEEGLTLGLVAHTQNFINFNIVRNISNYDGTYTRF